MAGSNFLKDVERDHEPKIVDIVKRILLKKSSLFACDSNVYVDRYDRNAGRFEDLWYLYQPESHQSSSQQH